MVQSKEIKESVRRMLRKLDANEITEEDLSKITSISLKYKNYKGEVNDCNLHELSQLKNLERITLGGFSITDEVVDCINDVPNLSILTLGHCRIETEKEFSNPLKALVLNWTRAYSMANFKTCSGLKVLRMIHVGDVNAEDLLPFQEVERLDVCEANIKNVKAFDQLPTVKKLCLDGSKTDDKYKPTNQNIEYSNNDEFFLLD